MSDLGAVQVGDTIVVRGGLNHSVRLVTVERLTATQIVITGGVRWSRRTGQLLGVKDAWHPTWIEPLDEQNARVLAEMRRAQWQRKIGERIQHGRIAFTADQLQRIAAIMAEGLPADPEKEG